MLLFPNAKINIGLFVTERRSDGYHNLQTLFYPIPLTDALEVVDSSDGSTRFYQYGTPIEGTSSDNLVMKAYSLLANDFVLPPLHVHLYKQIPMGAGMGGGSADAAYMLKLLNSHCELALTDDRLAHYAAQLGADCPFFIYNRPLLAEGIGNIFSECSILLKGYQLLLVKPSIHIATKEAYANIQPQQPAMHLREIVSQPIETWKEVLKNDFENSIFPAHPELKYIKEALYEQGALYAAMSGSGSTIYGIFNAETPITHVATRFTDCYVAQLIL